MDTYEFIDPIFPDDEIVERDFYLMGVRHHLNCRGENCSERPIIRERDELYLSRESNNEYDQFAVRVELQNGQLIGYIPRYYSESVSKRILNNMTYSCVVLEVNLKSECETCIKARLRIPRE